MNYTDKFNKITSAIRDKGEEILPEGARIVLYGSRARGDFNEESDWDFHILIPGNKSISWDEKDNLAFPFEMIGWNFGETVSIVIYSYGDWQKRKCLPYFENVERDKFIILYK